jgi:hypothetical protein
MLPQALERLAVAVTVGAVPRGQVTAPEDATTCSAASTFPQKRSERHDLACQDIRFRAKRNSVRRTAQMTSSTSSSVSFGDSGSERVRSEIHSAFGRSPGT